ncbi:MAG TPA: hypothetical protein VNA69_24750 [Thermoanaerobaculia bacterium]|nr:hypothetical protein [Thermoanaerobaculia bacterium]
MRDRRSFPRPPLWLNLTLLLLGVAGVLFARYHRERVSTRYANVLAEEARTPADAKKMKDELAELDLSREALQRELEGRMKFVASLKSENFYLSIDTRDRKLRFYYGDTVLREGDVQIGASQNIAAKDGRTWTFLPLKGAFPVQAKLVGYDWPVPDWVYAQRGEPAPPARPVIPNGLGKYVLVLGNGYVIHTQPAEGSPLQGPKPGSFLVSEEDLAAIWDRIHTRATHVYIY